MIVISVNNLELMYIDKKKEKLNQQKENQYR